MNSRPAVPPQPASGPAGVATTPTTRSPVTRLAAAWWALVVGLVILIILLIFVAQNTGSITAHFLGLDWSLPVGVGYLLAAAAGATATVLVGAARMIQLRQVAKKRTSGRFERSRRNATAIDTTLTRSRGRPERRASMF